MAMRPSEIVSSMPMRPPEISVESPIVSSMAMCLPKIDQLPSATELHEAGITIKNSILSSMAMRPPEIIVESRIDASMPLLSSSMAMPPPGLPEISVESPMDASMAMPPPEIDQLPLMIDQLPSATELHEAGITIKKSKTGNINNISFDNGVLSLPRIMVDDTMEPIFLNLIAFERFHPGIGNEVTSYVAFMDDIIDNAKDVKLLRSLEIIHNLVGSDVALAELFNSLSKDVPLNLYTGSLNNVRQKATLYTRKPWNEWRANLIHTYFRNPWSTLSVIAASFLLGLTITQTIYAIVQYYQ